MQKADSATSSWTSYRCVVTVWCIGLELHRPVTGKIRRHINVGCVRLKSFGCDLQLESAKARVRELKESVLVGFGCVCGTRTTWVVLKHYFRLGLLVYVCNILESDPAVQAGPTGLSQTRA